MYASSRDAAMGLFVPSDYPLESKLRIRALWTVCRCVSSIEEAEDMAQMLGLVEKGAVLANPLMTR